MASITDGIYKSLKYFTSECRSNTRHLLKKSGGTYKASRFIALGCSAFLKGSSINLKRKINKNGLMDSWNSRCCSVRSSKPQRGCERSLQPGRKWYCSLWVPSTWRRRLSPRRGCAAVSVRPRTAARPRTPRSLRSARARQARPVAPRSVCVSGAQRRFDPLSHNPGVPA